jgi:fusion and transport protein UGO1
MGRRPAKKIRKFKKQTDYHSSSSEAEEDGADFAAVNLQDSDNDGTDVVTGVNAVPMAAQHIPKPPKAVVEPGSDDEEDEADKEKDDEDVESDADAGAESDITGASSDYESEGSTTGDAPNKKKKRNDPTAFATSISKILNTKLTTTKRADPVLSRSRDASKASKELAESRLEAKARHKIRTERREALEKGRIKDVLGLENSEMSTQVIMETEKKLRKTAQRGVVKLFNAVREAQRRGEDAKKDALKQGIVGMGAREEKVSEMSKKGFLELIASGGSKRAGSVDV